MEVIRLLRLEIPVPARTINQIDDLLAQIRLQSSGKQVGTQFNTSEVGFNITNEMDGSMVHGTGLENQYVIAMGYSNDTISQLLRVVVDYLLEDPPSMVTPAGQRCKVLVLYADPQRNLELIGEFKEITRVLQGTLLGPEKIEVVPVFASDRRDLEQYISYHQPPFVYFSGHGADWWGFVFQDDPTDSIDGLKFVVDVIRDYKQHIKGVIFNFCMSRAIAAQIAEFIPLCYGTSVNINDDHAIEFSKGFFTGLGNSNPVDVALNHAARNYNLAGGKQTDYQIFVKDEVKGKNALVLCGVEKSGIDRTTDLLFYEWLLRALYLSVEDGGRYISQYARNTSPILGVNIDNPNRISILNGRYHLIIQGKMVSLESSGGYVFEEGELFDDFFRKLRMNLGLI